MHPLFGKRGVMLAGLLALALAALTPTAASARPEPGARGRGFRLFARSLGALTVNRVYCGLATTGEVCVDSTNSSTIGGGFWPKGTADQYIFNSGLQLAGVVGGSKPANPWGGDTTGAYFFNPRGDNTHGVEVQPIYNSQNPEDVANWPDAARVPQGDAQGDLFDPLLQGRVNASQGDIWFLTTEANPAQNGGRPHPLGVLVETRGMGWNFPTGNPDIIYFIYTFYNITSTNPAAYANVRPSMQPILMQQAQQFQALNNAKFGITLPADGYPLTNLFAAFSRDDDVGNAGTDYSSVNLPFALGYTYEQTFGRPTGWNFDPTIFSPPFFPGVGFTGAKYLKSPTGPGQIQLFSNTTNGGSFVDSRNVAQLFRYLSGTVSTAKGDQACNEGDPSITRICNINNGTAQDMRFFQSSTPLTLAPGEFGSIVVAYIFAAPVGPAPGVNLAPKEPRVLDPKTIAGRDSLLAGANKIDSMAGFRGWTDINGDCATAVPTSTVGCAQQNEFTVVPGSLLGKANTAQAVFDAKFLLPFAPDSPEFFLVPGDNQVTVLWRPSPSETGGDPFFEVARHPTKFEVDPVTGISQEVSNPLYDPNYRQFDVEGYRIYRGRVDAPNALSLLAQFDYGGTSMSDFAGQVNPDIKCAPELNIFVANCPFDNPFPVPGSLTQVRIKNRAVPLTGELVQVALGARAALASGNAILLAADTAVTGGGTQGSCAPSACPQLKDTGVPFVYVDNTVRNNFRYFYSVTAFDINSFQSGPSNLESPRLTKAVTPRAAASNYDVAGHVTGFSMTGRGVALDSGGPKPTIDPTTGEFSGRFPPANGWSIGLADFVATVLSQPGNFTVQQDSVQLGSAAAGVPVQYFYHVVGSSPNVVFSVPVVQSATTGVATGAGQFAAVPIDQALAARFGGSNQFNLQGKITQSIDGGYYTGLYGRGCVNVAPGFGDDAVTCSYNGARWFAGPSPQNNENTPNPNGNDVANFSGDPMPSYSNAGSLPGVVTIHETKAYETVGGGEYRDVSTILSGAVASADYNVYWGSGGTVDSVIDAVHNIVMPFDTAMGASWGLLNAGDVPAAVGYDQHDYLTNTDFGCVYPIKGKYSVSITCSAPGPVNLKKTAVPGPVVFFAGGSLANSRTAPVAANAGIGMYIAGHIFTFELAGGALPAQGTVWTMRSYNGAINGGHGVGAGDQGDYSFSNPEGKRTLAAPGVQLAVQFDVTNQLVAATRADLTKVHTVPDPYYITSQFEQTTDTKLIKFVNLPNDAIIRIYSSSGVLVDLLEHHSTQFGGSEDWNVRNRNNQVVASGVYFYHIEAGDARRVGRFTIVNFAQ